MKISTAQYATALYEATKGKSQSEIDSIVAQFVNVLAKSNQVKNIQNIIGKFKDVWNKKEGIVEAEITTSRKLENHQAHTIESFLKEKYKAEKVEIIEKIDPRIKGGIIIRVGDEVMDGSTERQLKDLKNKLTS